MPKLYLHITHLQFVSRLLTNYNLLIIRFIVLRKNVLSFIVYLRSLTAKFVICFTFNY